ncbi:hypothetical protein OG871_18245 [Kitasatospora sp. NBC_00374]
MAKSAHQYSGPPLNPPEQLVPNWSPPRLLWVGLSAQVLAL